MPYNTREFETNTGVLANTLKRGIGMAGFFERLKVHLNDVQKQAVLHTSGPLLLLATPGSGKTTTLIAKIGYLIEEMHINPEKILAVTFSRASAEDMKNRFVQLFPHLPVPIFSTIHSFAFQVVRDYYRDQGIDYQVIEGDGDGEKGFFAQKAPVHKKTILRRLYEEMVGEVISEDQVEELMNFVSYCKNKLLEEKDLDKIQTNLLYAKEIYLIYEQYKTKNPKSVLLDYDDMLTEAYRILKDHVEIRRSYQERFFYVLTDESQDTSLVQHKIVELLVEKHRNLCVVADDDQTIYSWRGADPEYLLKFREVYPEADVLYMEQNYRSTQTIVYVANQFIKRNENRYPKNMFTTNEVGDPIVIKTTETCDDQIRYLVDEIKKADNLSNIAILYRNNSTSIFLADALERSGIPFYIKDTDHKFFRHWIVEDILNIMRLSYDPTRVDILEKVHSKLRITKEQMEQLKQAHSNGHQGSVFDQLMAGEITPGQEKILLKYKEVIPLLKSMHPLHAIRAIREDLGYEKVVKKIAGRFGLSRDYLSDVFSILEMIACHQATLPDFAKRLNALERIILSSKQNRNENVLTLTTFHSSKGLEFDRVYILVNGTIPSFEDMEQKERMEEAVRLFYVAMTRARKHLELLSFRKSMQDGELIRESLFVRDIRNIIPKERKIEVEHPTATKVAEDFQVGDQVKHRVFGIGVVESLERNTIQIRFESGVKVLSLSVCKKKKLLEKLKENGEN